MKTIAYRLLFILLVALSPVCGKAASPFVNFQNGDFLLNKTSHLSLYLDEKDLRGVDLAAQNLCGDIHKVCNAQVAITHDRQADILVGTLGHSQAIDHLIDKKLLKGKTEKYIIQLIGHQLVIAGSDRRGTIYGIYELSRQIGVSPWYYWADVPIEHHDHIFIRQGLYTDGEPAVRYRGIFLNDEAPCLTSWVTHTSKTKYGGHEFYRKVFELILRLKGNMLWPAMWTYAFYADDPLNSKLADEMGVVIGTSHHEPMARNHEEWSRAHGGYGPWNYQTNQKVLDQFFRDGIKRIKGTEDIITIGMRGDGDEDMDGTTNTKLLERIVKNQRKIIADVTGKPARETPQVWALYKEVQDYYDQGMRVPDDVTIMLCDDNWGDIRRVPSAKERYRKGGWGLYYHVDYVGAPRNSKWLDVTPTQNMWEQLSLAYNYGINKIWILNVGDLKPMEYPIDFFMDMAWNPTRYTAADITDHTREFCAQSFGEGQAEEAAGILNLQGKYSGRSTVEMLNKDTYNLESGEWKEVADEYMNLETRALRQYMSLKPEYRDAYRELILFPVQAVCNIYQMYYAQAMNARLYKLGDKECNLWADKVKEDFARDSLLCRQYNKDIAGGKWDGMMIQKHIGYKDWNDNFPHDILPEIKYLPANKPDGGFVFSGDRQYVVMEAAHYYSLRQPDKAKWTEIPYMGRTRSGMTLLPCTEKPKDAAISYRFSMKDADIDSVEIHIITKSTLDFLNKGGFTYRVSLDKDAPVSVNFNKDLNEDPANIYSVYYPTVARRVVEKIIKVPIKRIAGTEHTLTIQPDDPGIVFEKIIVNGKGYQPQFLFGKESEYTCRKNIPGTL